MHLENQSLLTVVVPTYKRPQLLKRAINSILKQTYPYFEVLILDNASGNETRQVADDGRIAPKNIHTSELVSV